VHNFVLVAPQIAAAFVLATIASEGIKQNLTKKMCHLMLLGILGLCPLII